MATYALGRTRTSETGNPITFSYTVATGDSVIGLLLKVDGATVRAGGSPTLGPYTLTGTTIIAAASPETSAEEWFVLDPYPGTYTFTIPNTGGLNVRSTVVIGRAAAGGFLRVIQQGGSSGTSTNPSGGSVILSSAGNIIFAVVASGAQTWAPSAQAGTIIANTDDGNHGSGEQYLLNTAIGPVTVNWTFGTSEDWAVALMAFNEFPPNSFQNYHTPSSLSAGVISVGGIG